MSGVTGDDNTELTTIMSGGANFVARVTAYYKAKEEAEAALKKQGEIANFEAQKAEIEAAHAKIAEEAKAAEELSQRKIGDAGALASQMTADAGVMVEKARAQAAEIIDAAEKRAGELNSDAQNVQLKAQVAASAIHSRASEIDRQAREFADKQKELDAAIAAAKQSKDKYDARYATLTAALAAQG